MKVLYVGDFRELPNWGCRATGVALAQLIAGQHEIIDSIGCEALHWTGWGQYAEPAVRYGGMLPDFLFQKAWEKRNSIGKASRLYFRLDKFVGAKHDYMHDDLGESVREFHKARLSNPRLQEIYTRLTETDAVIFNGEGTMIFATPSRRDALFNLLLLKLAHDLGVKTYFVNAMFSDCPKTGRNEGTWKAARVAFAKCTHVVCRDRFSMDYFKEMCPNVPVTTIPDALFSWQSKVQSSARGVKACSDLIVPYGFEKYLGTYDFSQPYICLGGSSSADWKLGAAVSSYTKIAKSLQSLGHPVYIVKSCTGDNFLDQVASLANLPIIPYQVPVIAGAGIVANAKLLVSGRFHPTILASLGGTPAIFFGSNSHKMRTLQKVLGYEAEREFRNVPEEDEIPQILAAARDLLQQSDALRERLLETTKTRSQQAHKVLDVIEGKPVLPIL